MAENLRKSEYNSLTLLLLFPLELLYWIIYIKLKLLCFLYMYTYKLYVKW